RPVRREMEHGRRTRPDLASPGGRPLHEPGAARADRPATRSGVVSAPMRESAAAPSDGTAVVLCEGSFDSSEGKTAHGLVRHTTRYRVVAVIDSRGAGRDAGEVLDGLPCGIPIVKDLDEALRAAGGRADYLVVGVATHGGVLPDNCRPIVRQALERGMSVDSGLHQLLGDDRELAALARAHGAVIRDIRRTPPREAMHAFSGAILEVAAVRVAVLGTDSAVGKR